MRLSSVLKTILFFEIALYQPLHAGSPKFAIATVDPIATNAGTKTLMNGGNAFDAERSVGNEIINSLKLMGHKLQIYEKFGSSQAISEIEGKKDGNL